MAQPKARFEPYEKPLGILSHRVYDDNKLFSPANELEIAI